MSSTTVWQPEDEQMPGDVGRVVAVGASNLTRGFHVVVSTARAAWGPGVEVMAAFGHGRSYGADSSFVIRTIPGILQSGLWRALESHPPALTRALVTDVGNDILYGFSVDQTLEWVAEAVGRLQRSTSDIALTDVPLASIRGLSRAKFNAFRSYLHPRSRLQLGEVVDAAERLDEGLATLAATRGIRLCRLRREWYGIDPIHIRPSACRTAWEEILGCPASARGTTSSLLEAVRLYFLRPERRRLLGFQQFTPQSGTVLRSGGRVWLY